MKNIFVAFVILCSTAAPVARTPSHCSNSEEVIFSCQIKGSPKILSLCGSKRLTKEVGYLQYRFGRPGKVELEFPGERQNSQAKFRFAHYFRYQVDRTEVSFKNGNYGYAIYDYYEGEEKPARTEMGVRIEDSAPPNFSDGLSGLQCTGRIISRLNKLEDVIPCNKETALGNCQ